MSKKEMIPFDLEAAKRGEPLITRDGRKVDFIAHLENKNISHPVTAYIHETAGACSFTEDGVFFKDRDDCNNLFMAPKPKITVWVNVFSNELDGVSNALIFKTKEKALEHSETTYIRSQLSAVAKPVEIDNIF